MQPASQYPAAMPERPYCAAQKLPRQRRQLLLQCVSVPAERWRPIPGWQVTQLPPLEISATVVQNAAVSADHEELQEMFAELLAAGSDKRRASTTHPSFGNVIFELEPIMIARLKRAEKH